jgi:protein-S-isoprenylcysteine O-methyltransferase Ste14
MNSIRVFDLRRAQAQQSRIAGMWGKTSQRGVSAAGFVIAISVAALVASIIVPIAFGQFFSTDTSSWDAQTILIWGIVPLVVVLAIVLWFLNKADDQA